MEFQNINFQKAKLLIVGDVMLDQYWFGGTSRISPEAPVPVVQVGTINECPGGAANVALGIAALGAKPLLMGLTGQDDASFRLEKLLSAKAVDYHLSRVPQCPTITKLRVLSRNQQMIRLDTEKTFPKEMIQALYPKFQQSLTEINALVLSDYGKGTLSDCAWFINEAKARNVQVIVDPKSQDFSIYKGADVLTPNLKEFEAVVGHCATVEILVERGRSVLSEYNLGALVITRSEHGLSVITPDTATHIPALAKEVHDVTGAGDTVIAVLATALAAGMDLVKAAHLGNIAAGIAVGKLGAANVSVHEIQAALGKEQTLPLGVMTEDALLSAIRLSKANGERIVFTNGCFDILHAGHVLYLEQAKRLGDRVIVAVNTDSSVAKLKGPSRPVNPLEDRMAVLAGLRSVDWLVSFDEETPEKLIQKISPHILVKGGDYQNTAELPGAQFVLSQGGKVQVLSLKEGCSTTRTIDAIRTIDAMASPQLPTETV